MSENLENSGYRATREKKERLRKAGVRAKLYSLQAIIEQAVDDFLAKYEEKNGEAGLISTHSDAAAMQAQVSSDRLRSLELTLQEAIIEIGELRRTAAPGEDGITGPAAVGKHPPAPKRGSKQSAAK